MTKDLLAEADLLEKQASELQQEAKSIRRAVFLAQPLMDRLVFTAEQRCVCGLGMAYDRAGEIRTDKDSPYKLASQWECSGVLLGTGDKQKAHSRPLSFTFSSIASERDGKTTRPAPVAAAG